MRKQTSPHSKKVRANRQRQLQFGVLLIALALFNNWFLGLWLNPPLAGAATISELSVPTQPYAWLFRLCDILAGFLLLFLLWPWMRRFHSPIAQWLARAGLLALAVGNIIDASLPLDCILGKNDACSAGGFSIIGGLHLFESTVTALMITFLPLAVIVYAKRRRIAELARLSRYSWCLIIIMAVWGLDTIVRSMFDLGGHGYVQRIFMITLTAWVVVWWQSLPKLAPARPSTYSRLKSRIQRS